MQAARPDHPLFLTLDGMRGVGGMLVVVGHTIIFWGGLHTSSPPIPFCVDLFFLLSGFVIAFAYEPRFAGGMDAATFLREGITLEALHDLATALTDVQAAEELNEARAALFRRVPARTG